MYDSLHRFKDVGRRSEPIEHTDRGWQRGHTAISSGSKEAACHHDSQQRLHGAVISDRSARGHADSRAWAGMLALGIVLLTWLAVQAVMIGGILFLVAMFPLGWGFWRADQL